MSETLEHPIKEVDSKLEVFSFGDPESVLDAGTLSEYFQSLNMGKWYETPISMEGLSRALRSSPHHSSSIYVKRNILASTFKPHKLLSQHDFNAWALDYLVLGNGYLERRKNVFGKSLAMKHSLGKYTRRGSQDMNRYVFLKSFGEEHWFDSGKVFHLREPDINQEVYGVPEYISALQSALLNENATLFRRRYYKNGSHAGYILYMTDTSHKADDVEALREAVKKSKGPGNFRNLFMYAPGGTENGIKVIPLSEATAKDEFLNIKRVSMQDILAAHRMPAQLIGVMPEVAGGFGAIKPVTQVFIRNELKPLQTRFAELNEWLGEEVVRFENYELDTTE